MVEVEVWRPQLPFEEYVVTDLYLVYKISEIDKNLLGFSRDICDSFWATCNIPSQSKKVYDLNRLHLFTYLVRSTLYKANQKT